MEFYGIHHSGISNDGTIKTMLKLPWAQGSVIQNPISWLLKSHHWLEDFLR